MRGSVRLRIHTLDGNEPIHRPASSRALESGAGDWKARGIVKPEPIMRPRLYNIAQSSRFYRA
jgi:hypothetical protein